MLTYLVLTKPCAHTLFLCRMKSVAGQWLDTHAMFVTKVSRGKKCSFITRACCLVRNSVHKLIVIGYSLRLAYHLCIPYTTSLCFSVDWTLSLALSIVVSTETTLLSTHCSAKQGGSLSQCIAPFSLPLAHTLLFLRPAGNPSWSP